MQMILQEGDKLLVVHRRLFESDEARFFIGVVDGYESGIVKVTGFSWIREQFAGSFVEKKDPRTKIFSISSGTLMVYELPNQLDPKTARFESDHEGRLWLVDTGFKMNLSEKEYPKPAGRRL